MSKQMSRQAEAHHLIEDLDPAGLELVVALSTVLLAVDIADQFMQEKGLHAEFKAYAEKKFPGGKIPQ